MSSERNVLNYLDSINLNELNMVFCEQMDDKSKLWNFKKHSHNYLEVICFLEGKTRIDFKENSIDVSMYNIVVYPPHVEHQEFFNTNYRQDVIALGIFVNASKNLHTSFKIIDKEGLLIWFFKHIHKEFKKKGVKSHQLTTLYLQSIFLHMIRYFSHPHIETSDIVDMVTAHIQKNFDKHLTTNQLAAMASVSPSYLNRLFVKKLNTTPIKYLNTFRLKIAKKLLIDSNFSIEEIARHIGFMDTGYFWRVFKSATNVSPSVFRKQAHDFSK